jgi:glycosyltransferase involved in cell wall biosynthesis
MKVLCLVEHGNAPSTRLRLRDCLPDYHRLGLEITILSARRSSLRERFRVIRQARRYDAVVLFKTIGFAELELQLLHRRNPNIVFDFDDAVMFREQKYQRPLRNEDFQKFVRTLKYCVAVVAGNDFLASFAQACGRRTIVLPTPVDIKKYQVKDEAVSSTITVGWLGLSDGLQYVRYIEPALRRLSTRFPTLKLKVVSDKPLRLDGISIENENWRSETEQQNLASFDIGIMPLWDSLWTQGKCGYKILQYMGVGTAVVASDVGVNRQIINSGVNGFLARTEDDWFKSIATLIDNPELRRAFGLRGRELVERKYSVEYFAKKYAALLREFDQRPGR